MVVNVGAFSSDEIREELNRLAKLRAMALDELWSDANTRKLSREERNRKYDELIKKYNKPV